MIQSLLKKHQTLITAHLLSALVTSVNAQHYDLINYLNYLMLVLIWATISFQSDRQLSSSLPLKLLWII